MVAKRPKTNVDASKTALVPVKTTRVKTKFLTEASASIRKAMELKLIDGDLDRAAIEALKAMARIMDENYSNPEWKPAGDVLTSLYWKAMNDLKLTPGSRGVEGTKSEASGKLDALRAGKRLEDPAPTPDETDEDDDDGDYEDFN
jgi:hypothetical protein